MIQCAICKSDLSNCCIDCQVCGRAKEEVQHASCGNEDTRRLVNVASGTVAGDEAQGRTRTPTSRDDDGPLRSFGDDSTRDGHVQGGDRTTDHAASADRRACHTCTHVDGMQSSDAESSTRAGDTARSGEVVSSELSGHEQLTSSLLQQLRQRGGECAVAWGQCGHVFHFHCILRWVEQKSICPLCGQMWNLIKMTRNTT